MTFILFSVVATAQTDGGSAKPPQETVTQKINVFPNPATTVINVLGLQNSSRAEISVSDLYGNVVLNHRWKIHNNALNIPIATLEPGLYMISVRSREQDVKIKFYKQY